MAFCRVVGVEPITNSSFSQPHLRSSKNQSVKAILQSCNLLVVAQQCQVSSQTYQTYTSTGQVDITCRFSHPVGSLPISAISINDGAGNVEALNNTGASGDLCGGFTIRGKTPFSAWDTLQTTVKVAIMGQQVKDAYGVAFPDYSSNYTLDHRWA